MCGFGLSTIFEVAIFIIVVLAIIALINATGWLAGFVGPPDAPYGNIIRIVVGAVIAILILMFLWKMAECAGIMGRVGWQNNLDLLRLLG